MHVLRRLLENRPGLLPVEAKRPVQAASVMSTMETAGARDDRLLVARQRLTEVFTPTRPLPGSRFRSDGEPGSGPFVGRASERERILRALSEDRSHVAIYGERGRGKTSLANVALAQASALGFDVAYHICSATSDFSGIMRGLFHELPRWISGIVQDASEGRHGAAGLLPVSGPLRPGDILAACDRLPRSRIILAVDEFDRIADQDTRTAIADTIKQCSDRDAPVLFMIIGVSDSFEELLGRHPSIQRCVTRIGLPLLARAEAEEVVGRGAQRAGMQFPAAVRTGIAELSLGVPYMAQLLSLRAGQAALDDGRFVTCGSDVVAAIEAAVAEADPRVGALYERVTDFERDGAVLRALRAAAAGRQDAYGRFRVEAYTHWLRVAGVRVAPAAWHRVLQAGVVRAASSEDPGLYTFADVMLGHMVLMRAVLSQHGRAMTDAAPRARCMAV